MGARRALHPSEMCSAFVILPRSPLTSESPVSACSRAPKKPEHCHLHREGETLPERLGGCASYPQRSHHQTGLPRPVALRGA